ncbi:MAG: SMC-Scp complex subunit ScpB [Acidimicrobiia bacterium]|nr:SMC-Scp complex subunit ScpB [Acidimicrobiia bacterium]
MSAESERHLEAILMVAEEPVDAGVLAQVLEVAVDVVRDGLASLAARYEERGHGFCLREVAGGWRFYSHPDSAAYVQRFVLESENPRLSKAALETLAIVAYRQPISRAQVAQIRGVNCDAVMRTLVLRGLIEVGGTDDGPGQAALYVTTPVFLERMGLRDIGELPPLAPFVPGPDAAARWDEALADTEAAAADPDIAARVRAKIAEAAAVTPT